MNNLAPILTNDLTSLVLYKGHYSYRCKYIFKLLLMQHLAQYGKEVQSKRK